MLDRLTARVREFVDCEDAFGFRVLLRVDDAGSILVDGTAYPIVVSNSEQGVVAATLHMNTRDLEQILAGQLSPLTAFMTGRVTVDGDLGKAMRFSRLLD